MLSPYNHIYRSTVYSRDGSTLARFGPIVAKHVLHLLAMIDVSDISSPLHSKCLGNSFGHIFLFITVFKIVHVLFASPLFATNNEE